VPACGHSVAALNLHGMDGSMTGPPKIGTTNGRQSFRDLLPPHRMKLLAAYKGWLCTNEDCGLLIAPKVPESDRPRRVLTVKCPHCGTVQDRTWDALVPLRYEPRKEG